MTRDRAMAESIGIDREMLDRAVGGWRGLVDSGLPATVFVVVYLVGGLQLRSAVIAALGTGVVLALWHLARREPLQQVLSGFVGVAISAFVAARTGRAENYFLVGLLINLPYLVAYLVSLLVRWPLMGLVIGYFRGDPTGWRSDPRQYAAYATASWVWVAMFALRLSVQVPLYLLGAVGPLGVARLVMGWPLFLLAAFLTYRIVHPVLADERAEQREDEAELADGRGLEPEASG